MGIILVLDQLCQPFLYQSPLSGQFHDEPECAGEDNEQSSQCPSETE
jgi:hypothetical protein